MTKLRNLVQEKIILGIDDSLISSGSGNGNGTGSKGGKGSSNNRGFGNSVGNNTSGDGVSISEGFGHNVMGGVDVGIPGGVGKGGVGVGNNRGSLNLNLGSLNGLDSKPDIGHSGLF